MDKINMVNTNSPPKTWKFLLYCGLGVGLLGCDIENEFVSIPDASLEANSMEFSSTSADFNVDRSPDKTEPEVAFSNWGTGGEWPMGIIPYVIEETSAPVARRARWRQNIMNGIEHWNTNTNLVLVPYSQLNDAFFDSFPSLPSFVDLFPNRSRVVFKFKENTNYTCRMGYDGWANPNPFEDDCNFFADLAHRILLGDNGSSAAHEIGHAVGLWHEQGRVDRGTHLFFDGKGADNYKCDVLGFDSLTCNKSGPYDFDSLMHYASNSSSHDFAAMTRKDTWDYADNHGPHQICNQTLRTSLPKLNDSLVGNFDSDLNDEILFASNDGSLRFFDVGADCSQFTELPGGVGAGTNIQQLSIGDFDNDNQADILWSWGSSCTFLKSSDNYSSSPAPFNNCDPSTTRLGDIDRDGIDDLLFFTVQENQDFVSGLPLEPTGSLSVVLSTTGSTHVLHSGFPDDWSITRSLIGDVDGDNTDDIVFGVAGRLYLNDVLFQSWVDIGPLPTKVIWDHLFLTPDPSPANGTSHRLVVAYRFAERLKFWNGTFWENYAQRHSLVRRYGNFRIGDFNGNGDPWDLVTEGIIPRTITLSPLDIASINSKYPCSEASKNFFMGCGNPTPISTATAVSIL